MSTAPQRSIAVPPNGFCLAGLLYDEIGGDTSIDFGFCGISVEVSINSTELHGKLSVNTNGAFALTWLVDSHLHDNLSLTTNAGFDQVSLFGNTMDGNAMIDLGDLDDELWLGDPVLYAGVYPNVFNATLAVNGGAGFDELYHEPLYVYAAPPSSTGFESIFP